MIGATAVIENSDPRTGALIHRRRLGPCKIDLVIDDSGRGGLEVRPDKGAAGRTASDPLFYDLGAPFLEPEELRPHLDTLLRLSDRTLSSTPPVDPRSVLPAFRATQRPTGRTAPIPGKPPAVRAARAASHSGSTASAALLAAKENSPLAVSAAEALDATSVRRAVWRCAGRKFGLMSRKQLLGGAGSTDGGTDGGHAIDASLVAIASQSCRAVSKRGRAPLRSLSAHSNRSFSPSPSPEGSRPRVGGWGGDEKRAGLRSRGGELQEKLAGGELVLSGKQQLVLDFVKRGKSVFFTGSAGTGKSLLMRIILETMPASTTFACASTGIAACNVGGTTVNHFAGIGRGVGDPRDIARRVKRGRDAAGRWRACRLLIIDEVSMLSAATFELLDAVAREVRGNSMPFGGIQLVLVGDFFQLPPVQSGGASGRPPNGLHCFESPVWQQCVHENVTLDRVYRQQDDSFAALLNRVRTGDVTDADLQTLNRCVHRDFSAAIAADGVLPTTLLTHRADVDKLNAVRLDQLAGTVHRYQAADFGPENYVQYLDSACPARRALCLKVGAQVILNKTLSLDRGLVNGARGVVVRFTEPERGFPVVRFVTSAEEVVVAPEEWKVTYGSFTLASRRQLPLDLAWAVSIHKSQGMTLDRVVLDLSRVFECGQAYVALSRVRALTGLSLRAPVLRSTIRANPTVKAFYEGLQ